MFMVRLAFAVAVALPLIPCPMTAAGLSEAERRAFYHDAEGSELIPLELVRPLNNAATRSPFLDDPARFGLVPDADPANTEGLPIGLSSGASLDARLPEGLPMLGINCAACHVGELTFRGRAIRLDGAPNRFDVEWFNRELGESIKATLESAVEFREYLFRLVQGPDPRLLPPPAAAALRGLARGAQAVHDTTACESLADDLIAIVRAEAARTASQEEPGSFYSGFRRRKQGEPIATPPASATPVDPAVLDSLIRRHGAAGGGLTHLGSTNPPAALESALHGIRRIHTVLRSRMAFFRRLPAGKPLGVPGLNGRTDAFGHARNFLFPESGRSPDAPVDYPAIWGFDTIHWLHWDGNTTSVLERNTGQAIGLGAIYNGTTFESTIRLGGTHQLETLARQIPVPPWPEQVLGALDPVRVERGAGLFRTHCARCHWDQQPADRDFPSFPAAEIGTDPNRAARFATPLADGRGYDTALQSALGRIKEEAARHEDASNRLPEWEFGRTSEWRAPNRYVARPLRGIWATAPYLHNGSVPTLNDLLSRQRPSRFRVGHREFDPVLVGFTRNPPAGSRTQEFDTGLPGNGNRGHGYGTDLAEAEKLDLIEYLKTR